MSHFIFDDPGVDLLCPQFHNHVVDELDCCFILSGKKTSSLGFDFMGIKIAYGELSLCNKHSKFRGSKITIHRQNGHAGSNTAMGSVKLPDQVKTLDHKFIASNPKARIRLCCTECNINRHTDCGGHVINTRGWGYSCVDCHFRWPTGQGFWAHGIKGTFVEAISMIEDSEDEDIYGFTPTFSVIENPRKIFLTIAMKALKSRAYHEILVAKVNLVIDSILHERNGRTIWTNQVHKTKHIIIEAALSASDDPEGEIIEAALSASDQPEGFEQLRRHYALLLELENSEIEVEIGDDPTSENEVHHETLSIRKRGNRGGRKYIKKGECAKRLLSRSQRKNYKLGKYPTVEEFLRDHMDYKNHLGLKFVDTDKIHVISKNIVVEPLRHMAWVSVHKPQARIGAVLEDWPSDDADMPVEPNVGGSGDCWQKLGAMVKFEGSLYDLTHMKLSVLIESFVEAEYPKFALALRIKWEFDKDRDIHIDIVKPVFPFTKKLEGYQSIIEFKQTMREILGEYQVAMDRYVGDKTNALAKATMAMTSTAAQEAFDGANTQAVLDEMAKVNKYCPYYVPEEVREVANKMGISYFENSPKPHSHPLHHAISMEILYNIYPGYTNDLRTTIVNMKESRLENFLRETRKPRDHYVLKNIVREAKDLSRYKTYAPEVFEIGHISTPCMLFDQCAQFLTPGDILGLFESNRTLTTMILGHEFPLAALRSSTSPDPNLWQHRVSGKQLYYYPETDKSEPYAQPFDPRVLLSKTIESSDGKMILFCQVVFTKLNSHVQIISKIPFGVKEYLPVDNYEYVVLPKLHRNQFESDLVPRVIFDKMLAYMETVPNTDSREARAKLRQLVDPEKTWLPDGTIEEMIKVILCIRQRRKMTGEIDKHYDSLGGWLLYNTTGRLRKWHLSKWERRYARRWKSLSSVEHPMGLIPLVSIKQRSSKEKNSPQYFDITLPKGAGQNFWNAVGFWMRALFKNDPVDPNIDMIEMPDEDETFTPMSKRRFNDEGAKAVVALAAKQFRALYTIEEPPKRLKPAKPKHVKLMTNIDRSKLDEEFWDGYFITELADNVQFDVVQRTEYGKTLEATSFIELMQQATDKDRFFERQERIERAIGDSKKVVQWMDVKVPGAYTMDGEELEPSMHDYMFAATGNHPEVVEFLKANLGTGIVEEEETEDVVSLLDQFSEPDNDSDADKSEAETDSTGPLPENAFTQAISGEDLQNIIDESDNDPMIPPTDNWFEPQIDAIDPLKVEKVLDSEKLTWNPLHISIPALEFYDKMWPHSQGVRYMQVPAWPLVRQKLPYPKGRDCLLTAMSKIISSLTGRKINPYSLWVRCCRFFPRDDLEGYTSFGLSNDMANLLAVQYHLNLQIWSQGSLYQYIGVDEGKPYRLDHSILSGNLHHWSSGIKIPPLIISQFSKQVRTPSTKTGLKVYNKLSALPTVRKVDFKPCGERADKLLYEMINGSSFIFKDAASNMPRLKAWSIQVKAQLHYEDAHPIRREIGMIVGDPGCGKSAPIAAVLADKTLHRENAFSVVTAGTALRADWALKIGVRKKDDLTKRPSNISYCCTSDYFLAKAPRPEVLIVDENKFPPGYLSLVTLLMPSIRLILFAGDFFQGAWHDANGSPLNELMSELEWCEKYINSYILGSKRFGHEMGLIFNTPTIYNVPSGGLRFSDALMMSWQDMKRVYPEIKKNADLKEIWSDHLTLEASRAAVDVSEGLNNTNVITASSAQGLTTSMAQVNVDRTVTTKVGPEIMWVACSRSQRLVLVFTGSQNGSAASERWNNPVIQTLYEYKVGTRAGSSAKYKVGKQIDFRQMQGGIKQNWDLILAFPPDKSSNWEQLRHNFKPIVGYLDGINYVPLGGRLLGGFKTFKENLADMGYDGHPMMRTRELGYKIPVDDKVEVPEYEAPTNKVRTKIPLAVEKDFVEMMNAKLSDKWNRENFTRRYGYTNQVLEGTFLRQDAEYEVARATEPPATRMQMNKVRQTLMAAELSESLVRYRAEATQWILTHTKKDDASNSMTWKKRVRPGNHKANLMEYHEQVPFGDKLWSSVKKYLNWPGMKARKRFTAHGYEQAIGKFGAKRANRSGALKMMGLTRSEPEFTPRLDMKTQKKMKKLDPPKASAPQGVVTFDDEYIFEGGAFGTYLLDLLLENLPDYAYFHCRKSIGQLLAWTETRASGATEYWESDLESQEKSMTAAYVYLIADCLMPYLGFPVKACDFFRKNGLKVTLSGTEIGVMTFSGMLLTYLSNSFGNLARITAKYDLRPGEPVKFGGDDFLAYRWLKQNHDYGPWEVHDIAVEKINLRKDCGTFIGFVERKGLMFKDPELMLMKLLVHIEQGHARDVIKGYFLEFSIGYAKGDLLYHCMSIEQMEAHQILTRMFMNLQKDLKLSTKLDWKGIMASPDEDVLLMRSSYQYNYASVDPQFSQDITEGNKLGEYREPLFEENML